MSDIRIETADTTAALNSGERGLGHVREVLDTATERSSDPRVRATLRALRERTVGTADESAQSARTAATGVRSTVANDSTAASNARSVPAPQFSPASNVSGGGFTQPAMMMPQQSAMQQAMAMPQALISPAASMLQTATSALPAGTVLLSAGQMAQLWGAAGGGGSGFSGQPSAGVQRTSWTGSTAPDPLDPSQVSYQKGPGKMSEAQQDAAIDSAMDKTGVTDPAARGKWKALLKMMGYAESGADSNAVNMSDSNAVGATQVDGAPEQSSRGWLQTIPATFAAHHASGTSNSIYDPEASAAAAINYISSRYNVGKADASGIDAFAAARQSGGYTGY